MGDLMSQANVRSVDAIKDFKIALIAFAEDARVALDSMEMEIRQTRNWMERDQFAFWKSQVKRGHEQLAEARAELHRRKVSQINSDAVSDSDQKEAVRMAQRRLQEAEEKVERIKRWGPVLEHALSEYHSQAQPLGDRLSGSLVASIALLERMIRAIEEYTAIEAPSAPVLPPASSPDTPASTSVSPGSRRAGTAAPRVSDVTGRPIPESSAPVDEPEGEESDAPAP